MRIEIRADAARLSGYVNVTEKKSRPVMTPHGLVVEEIEPHVFQRAIERAGDISVTVDHDSTHVYAGTKDGTLELYEDDIGLHADVTIKDQTLISLAKEGRIKGWSFGMYNVVDELEPRAGELPLRRVKGLDLDHLTLVVNKTPVYSATSVEVRAEGELTLETRARMDNTQITEEAEDTAPPFFDNSAFRARADALKKGEK